MRVRFLSRNEYKIAEASTILKSVGVELVPVHLPIDELQSDNVRAIVRNKTLRAFHLLGYPVFVEQTCLFLTELNGFPGGLTQVFWDTLRKERVARLFGGGSVTAKTEIGYCNGRQISYFQGSINGIIAPEPRGDDSFQWDCVFIPEGYEQTFAEMGEKKNEISMRKLALDAFAAHLESSRHD
ncbi:non-canonical purine NTP pyrophosphatase [Segnochrobactrum spirostomi]|uniref:Non-canonical purine NTP pyrophosphatase n=1 Tax=Segnochrobactrum spirostomi TaxID=2608987 RepID=A0A6A7XXU5_9HYPH|nr:non-canonical purine NTP pyrophosphatase [Segnochrobactrum spirostomi]MQT11183.1 non-canonical purine NTP pyrophosphatase [Segnochrobactrum spirostomi]